MRKTRRALPTRAVDTAALRAQRNRKKSKARDDEQRSNIDSMVGEIHGSLAAAPAPKAAPVVPRVRRTRTDVSLALAGFERLETK